MSVIKTRQRETALEDATDDALRIEPAHTTPTEGWQVDLEQALSELPDDNRVAVSMFYMGDCSLKEISEFLGVSVNTVKGKLYRARQQLGSALSERYGSLLKNHKLKGGFLMQFMEQIHHIPSPTMASSWSSTAIGKILFSLIMAVCVLIGIARHGTDSPMSQPSNRIGVGPTEVALLAPITGATRSSIPVASPAASTQTENRPPAGSSRVSDNQDRQLAARRATPGSGGNAQLPAAAMNIFKKLSFSGRVIDNNSMPVADAEIRYAVSFYPLEGDTESGRSSYYTSDSFTRTRVDGTFRFGLRLSRLEWMPFDSKEMLSRLNIAVTHPDHAIWWQEFPFQSAADVEIQLEMPEIISGKVMNEAGEPIQNAEILMHSLSRGDPMLREPGDNLTRDALPQPIRTDENGEFVLRGLPQGATTSLEVKGLGYAKQNRYGVLVGGEGLEFRLKREGRIEGRLTYASTGEPVKDARVGLERIFPNYGYGEARADSNGNYLLENLTPGTYSLHLAHGPKGWTAIAKESMAVLEGQIVSNVDLPLIRSGFITGRVTDRDTNEPIANHHISFHDAARPEASQTPTRHAITGSTGTYHFDAAPGRVLVHTNPPVGYQDIGRAERLNIGQVRRYVDVVEGDTVVVDFQFSRGLKLVGRVLTEIGEPVTGARITDPRDGHKEYDRSDELGVFTVGGLRSGQRLDLKAVHSGLGLRGVAEVEVQPDVPVEIRMEPYGRVKVSGRVVNHEGKPMPLMNVHLTRWNSQPYGGYGANVTAYGTNVAGTDKDGRFQEIELIVGDEYTISVEVEGYREAETERFTATAEMTQIADLVLLPAGGQFFIEGRVTDTSGEPVNGAQLSIIQQSQHWLTVTDENGDYRLEDLSMAVVLTLHIRHPGYAHHKFRILKTKQRHDLVLVKADGYLAGKVVDADGQPIVERVRVIIKAKEDPFFDYRYFPGSLTNLQGEFELKHIKDPIVSIQVSDETNLKTLKIFRDITVNQRDLVLTLTPPEPKPELTPEQQAEREVQQSYVNAAEERVKTLVNQPAPELSVAEWLSGSPTSIEDLKGKTIALHFWALDNIHHVRQIRLLNILQEVYQDKGLVCVAICPAATAVETLKQHIAAESLSYSVGLDLSINVVGARGETSDLYAVGGRSEIVLINTAGEIAARAWDSELEDKIQVLLAD